VFIWIVVLMRTKVIWLTSVSRYGVLRREVEFGAPPFAFCVHTTQVITE